MSSSLLGYEGPTSALILSRLRFFQNHKPSTPVWSLGLDPILTPEPSSNPSVQVSINVASAQDLRFKTRPVIFREEVLCGYCIIRDCKLSL